MLTVLFLAKKITRYKLFFKSASLHFSHAWKICILEKQATEVILVGWCGKCQSIKKVGSRRFVEGLYQALFSFRLACRNIITKRNENWAWSQVSIIRSLDNIPNIFNIALYFLQSWPGYSGHPIICNSQLSCHFPRLTIVHRFDCTNVVLYDVKSLSLKATTWIAQLDKCPGAEQEAAGSNPSQTNTQGLVFSKCYF